MQGVDWRNVDGHACNAGITPLGERWNDGVNLDPLEVMFIKVGHPCLRGMRCGCAALHVAICTHAAPLLPHMLALPCLPVRGCR